MDDKSQKTVELRITGRVQGVWFRASTKDKASELGVTGFVRNEKDGSVYSVASGPEQAIEQFIKWCKHGPELAKVDQVQVHALPSREFDGFRIDK